MFHCRIGFKIMAGFCIMVFLTLFSYLQFNVITTPYTLQQTNADAIIILGHSLIDGEVPGQWLVARLEEGLALYNKGYAKTIIVTGGEGPSDNIAVALSMKHWLIDNGVSPDTIIIETEAKNTFENFRYIHQIIVSERLPIDSIIVVSSDFHMYRSLKIAGYFFDCVSGSASDVPLDLHKILAYMKEPFSVVKYSIINLFLYVS